MSSSSSMRASDSSVAVAEKPVARSTASKKAAVVKSAPVPKVKEVTLRRSAGSGRVPKGHYLLILNPRVYGSTGDNWLGGKSYPDRDAAIGAAKKAGVRVLNA